MKRMFDYSLYLVTDRALSRGRTTSDIVRAGRCRRRHLRAAAGEGLPDARIHRRSPSAEIHTATCRHPPYHQRPAGCGPGRRCRRRPSRAAGYGHRRCPSSCSVLKSSSVSRPSRLRMPSGPRPRGRIISASVRSLPRRRKRIRLLPLGLDGIQRIRSGSPSSPGRNRRHNRRQCGGR